MEPTQKVSSPFVDVGGQITGDTSDSIARTGFQRPSYRSGERPGLVMVLPGCNWGLAGQSAPTRWFRPHVKNFGQTLLFSVYVPWPVSRHSEPLIPETDENRLSAFVTGRPRPPRRLQLERKVTKESSKWEIDDN